MKNSEHVSDGRERNFMNKLRHSKVGKAVIVGGLAAGVAVGLERNLSDGNPREAAPIEQSSNHRVDQPNHVFIHDSIIPDSGLTKAKIDTKPKPKYDRQHPDPHGDKSRGIPPDLATLYSERNPIAKDTPFFGKDFDVGVGPTKEYKSSDPYKEAIYIRVKGPGGKQEALQWINDHGINASKLEIIYIK